ncbi:hypothetical protein [Paraburkholderia hayleyella]|uniref:hypothetical protein n=1 Tax=Paraburkholderia hayleyella TaxID=2152889 RepID=UPI0012919A95|nr:hypothetical protein [Paraburkholderia hayleyella]
MQGIRPTKPSSLYNVQTDDPEQASEQQNHATRHPAKPPQQSSSDNGTMDYLRGQQPHYSGNQISMTTSDGQRINISLSGGTNKGAETKNNQWSNTIISNDANGTSITSNNAFGSTSIKNNSDGTTIINSSTSGTTAICNQGHNVGAGSEAASGNLNNTADAHGPANTNTAQTHSEFNPAWLRAASGDDTHAGIDRSGANSLADPDKKDSV